MNRVGNFLRRLLRACVSAVVSLVVWTVWLALTLTLGIQIYVASTNELAVPDWLLHSLEQRLESSGIRARFGRTSFDPSGRLLIEDASVLLPSFPEPVLSANYVYVRLDPWALVIGRFEPRELRIGGGKWLVPAMLSNTGRVEEVVRDFDATVKPGATGEIIVESLSAHIATLSVNARGTLYVPPQTKPGGKLPVADFVATHYAAFCRQLIAVTGKLDALEEPSIQVELEPSESRGAIASVVLLARGVKLDAPVALQATGLRLATRFPLLGETPVTTRLELTADELHLPRNLVARGVRAGVRGPLRPALLTFEPDDLDLAADYATAEGVTTTALAAHLVPGPLPRLHAELIARVMDGPLAVEADTNFTAQTATLHFDGALAPGLLDVVSARIGHDVRKFVDFTTPIIARDGEAVFTAGWKFERLGAHVDTGEVRAYHVVIDEAHGRVELTPHRFAAPEAYARIGKNFGRGSYENDFITKDYRFLLEGQLEPLAISGWFTAWWPNFFQAFEFPAGPPAASVDVQGRWTDGHRANIFVYADLNSPLIRGTHLDWARTLLFIRPGFFDAAEVFGTLGAGVARGKFTYVLDPAGAEWKQFDFDGTSTLDLDVAAHLIGPSSAEWLGPFKFERPPSVKVSGQLERAAAGDVHSQLQIEAKSDGAFRFHDFPLEHVRFKAMLHDDDIAIDDIEAGFAGGATTGHVKIWGRDAARRLRFEYGLKDASLGRAIAVLEAYVATRKGATPAPNKFVQEKNNVRLELSATAEGNYSDSYSYHGHGVAELRGAELGEVRLLGGLSETLRFTLLRFTTASATFRIEGAKLVFPEISLTGDNSAIQAHGEYALDRRQLDFNAKVFPFQESGFILKKILDVALTPLSNVFEVKLTGALDKPTWGLVLGPTNFLRNLTQPEHEPAPAPPTSAPEAAVAPHSP